MKKILAILSGAMLLLSACSEKGSNGSEEILNFPEVQNLTVESGKSYEITFTAEKAWAVSLPAISQQYATMTYGGITEMQFYGEANVETTITVNVREGLLSYAKDFVFNVEITMDNKTEDIAILTIPRTPYEITVSGNAPAGSEDFVQSTFEKGGHPENGPFVSAANTYTVRYLNPSDAKYGEFVVTHDLDLLYNYVLYGRDENGEFVVIEDEDNSWLQLHKYVNKTGKHFQLAMEYDKPDAVLTEGVGYEAYVNLEDENGDPIISVYFIYDPNAVVEVPPAISLAFPEEASASGVQFEGDDSGYTLTLKTQSQLVDDHKAASLNIKGYQGYTLEKENLDLVYDKELEVYYLTLIDKEVVDMLERENSFTITIVNAIGAVECPITVIFDWIEEK